jgi:2-polyprenyl-3-methyl-5-hydroxy-6-metoxy-1,4-benzoquinol methylase
MIDRKMRQKEAEGFFEGLWKRGDPWDFETSEFENAKYQREIQLIRDRHYGRVLEIGCGAGVFTRRLASVGERILALDVSPTAISRAKNATSNLNNVEFRVQNIMDFDFRVEEKWDLVVFNETVCYLGWLYTFFEVAWFAGELFSAMQHGGRLLMANTLGGTNDHLITPPIINTYHDLFRNVGYTVSSEEIFTGMKSGVSLDVLISVFTRPSDT